VLVKIKVDKENLHHELIMFADNFGSILLNTLLILTAGNKCFEIFISSTKQKNENILVDLKQ
jgi:hypothetical protein